MEKKLLIAINFIKEHFFTFFTFFIIFLLFYVSTPVGDRADSLWQIICEAFFDFDMNVDERICLQ